MSSPNSGSAYCHNCGSELPPGATFCPKCGTRVYAPAGGTPPPSTPPPSSPSPYNDRHAYRDWRRQQRRNEKGEKNEENEKGEKGEKGHGGAGSLIGPLIGGAILIWLGISFFLQDYYPALAGNWWALFLIGLGVILILMGGLYSSRAHHPVIGPFIGGGIMVIIGLAFFSNAFNYFWPLILIVIGLAIVVSALTARQRSPNPTTP